MSNRPQLTATPLQIPPTRQIWGDTCSLLNTDVHLWLVPLTFTQTTLQLMESWLSPDEIAQADRFRFAYDRLRFIARRGALRSLLAGYLQAKPQNLRFGFGRHGKPFILGQIGRNALNFNLSKSNNLSVIAVTRGREVGIDIEHHRTDIDLESVAKCFFSSKETRVFLALPPSARMKAFFHMWTCKEAYLKARGTGLFGKPNGFDVCVLDDEAAGQNHARMTPAEPTNWPMHYFSPAEGYTAALTVEGDQWQIHYRQWEPLFLPKTRAY